MSSKYFVNGTDLSTKVNLNPNSTVNLNTVFNGVDLYNDALDNVSSYFFDTSSNLQNIKTNFTYKNVDIINYCYPKQYVEYTTSQSNISVPSNLINGVKVVLIGVGVEVEQVVEVVLLFMMVHLLLQYHKELVVEVVVVLEY